MTRAYIAPAPGNRLVPTAQKPSRLAMNATPSTDAPPTPAADPAEAIVRAAESALEVKRRYQFFVWSQSHLSRLIPHQLAVCGSYDRASRDLSFDVFNSVSVPYELLAAFSHGQSALMRRLQTVWLAAGGKAALVETEALPEHMLADERAALREARIAQLLVHGISRPQRPQEIESFFVFANGGTAPPTRLALLELLIPHVHGAWQRVQAVERDVGLGAAPPPPAARGNTVTQREVEILSWLREGMSNQQIAAQLGISALTVKNHIQKILRKLGAANRAQAVAQALSLQLLERAATPPALPRVRVTQ